jgi:hypothetical protein
MSEVDVRWGVRKVRVRFEKKEGWPGLSIGTFGHVSIVRDDLGGGARASMALEQEHLKHATSFASRRSVPVCVDGGWKASLDEAVQALYDNIVALEKWCKAQRKVP